MSARSEWGRIAADAVILLVELVAISAPLGLVLLSRYADASGVGVPAWADVRRPGTLRVLIVMYAVLAIVFVAERWARGSGGWRWGRRGATMAALGPPLASAPPGAVPEGSATETGSASNGRQVSESNAEEDPAEEGGSGQEGAEVASASR